MSEKKVVTQGGGENLFKVSEYDGWFYVYKAGLGFFSTGTQSIGKTRNMKDALDIVRSYSGHDIEKIEDW